MPPRNARSGPGPNPSRFPEIAAAATAKQDDRPSRPILTDPAVQLQAWQRTVEHLHALGLPAPAPEFVSAWLRRQGIRPDWETAA